LLELSLRENLDPEGLHSDEEIWDALEKSHVCLPSNYSLPAFSADNQLKAHVETLAGKLDELMSGDGGVFSRGQRQLLALARALLRQRHILALDGRFPFLLMFTQANFLEATSSVDAQTDADIQHTIRTYFNDATVLTIAHRISTIIDYDLIIVMDQGKIIEMGEPSTLLEREGAFWKLAVEGGAIQDTSGGAGASGGNAE
jgi:ATP-binding cassette subfamily C (CFTR/MRP) protein 1